MNIRIAINFRSRRLKDFCFHALCEPKHVDSAMNAGFGRLHRIPLVVNWRGGTREVIDFVDLNVERECYVVPRQFETLVIEKMLDILAGTGEKVIDAENVSAPREQPLAKMRAEKSRPAGH